jgi:FkbM family methyltransferase
MALFATLSFIASHPVNRDQRARALLKYFKWQIGSRLLLGQAIIPWINGARLIVQRGDTGVTGNIYCGLHDFADMTYLLHVIERDDLFVDIGANLGSYTVLACAAKGARGYCFEPVPGTFARLTDNIRLNDLSDRVVACNLGIADKSGRLTFTASQDTTNHVVTDAEKGLDTVHVEVQPLDIALRGESPSVIKIDVEGFEVPVLEGARTTLANPALHSVILELNGSGRRYGYQDQRIVAVMHESGFSAYRYEPASRELTHLGDQVGHAGNTLFIRDAARITERLKRASKVLIGNRWI